jgi:hypothetical protein
LPPSVPGALTEVNHGVAAALRQNAWLARAAKFHCKPSSCSEILGRLLNELT